MSDNELNAQMKQVFQEYQMNVRREFTEVRTAKGIHGFKDGGLVYHYSSLSGLKGIIEKNCFWATNLRFVNDPRELETGHETVKEAGENLLQKYSNEPKYRDLLEAFLQKWDGASDVYATCFTRKGDHLTLWRAYCESDRGVCIGFDAATLYFLLRLKKAPLTDSVPVVYESEIQQELSTDLIEICIKHLPPDNQMSSLPGLWDNIFEDICLLNRGFSVGFKQSGFSEEDEQRIFAVPSIDQVKLREKNGTLIPFIELHLVEGDKLPIREIIIRPPEDFDRVKAVVEILLKQNGFQDDVDIKASEISYRRG